MLYSVGLAEVDKRALNEISKFLECKGGLIESEVESLPKFMQWHSYRFIDYLKVMRHINELRDILCRSYYGIVNDDSLNAVATRYKDWYFFGINIGTIRNISAFYDLILSHPDIMTHIGDAS